MSSREINHTFDVSGLSSSMVFPAHPVVSRLWSLPSEECISQPSRNANGIALGCRFRGSKPSNYTTFWNHWDAFARSVSSSSLSFCDGMSGVEYLWSSLGLWSRKVLYFLPAIVIPARPQVILAFVGQHHLSFIIKTWEEENVDIPIDNACTVPACVTVSCVLPSPIWKPTR